MSKFHRIGLSIGKNNIGDERWYFNKKLHRVNGFSFICKSGYSYNDLYDELIIMNINKLVI